MNQIVRFALVSAAAAVLLPACNRPSGLPDMGVSRNTVAFEAPGGSGEPAPQVVYVVNTGRGSLVAPSAEIVYQQGSGWLAAVVGDGGAPFGVELRATSAGLESGVYRATLTLSCANASASPAQVAVTLTVPDPRFTLSTATVFIDAPRGGGDPPARTFEVLNAGRGALPFPHVDVEYAGTAGWLGVSTTGTSDRYTVTVSVTVAGLDSGVHEAALTVSAPGGSMLPRSLRVLLTVPPAELAVATSEVRLEGPSDASDPQPAEFAVTNAGGGLLATPTATVSYPAGWTGPQWLSATVSGTPAGYLVTVQGWQVRPGARLDSGPNVATVTLTSPDAANPPQAVAVTIMVPPPVVTLSRTSVSFSGNSTCGLPPPAWPIRVSNVGPGRMARPVVELSPELVGAVEATVLGDEQPYAVRFTVVRPVYAWGTATLTAPGVQGAWTIDVNAYIDGSGPTAVQGPSTPTVIHAQAGAGDPGPARVRLSSSGGCPASASVAVVYPTGTQPWVSATTATGLGDYSLPYLDVIVRASTAGMAVGDVRSAELIVTPEGLSSVVVPVTLEVGAVRSGPGLTGGERHTVTALRNGGAMVVGGLSTTPRDRIEMWSPAEGRWLGWSFANFAWRLRHARYDHGAIEIGDRVLVCGGLTASGPELSCEFISESGYYDPVLAGTLLRPRVNPTLIPLADQTVLVASPNEVPELFDPTTGRSSLVEGLIGWSAVKLTEEQVLLTAGQDAVIFEPARGVWRPTGALWSPRIDPALVLLEDGRVLAVGGPSTPWAVAVWDPATGAWADCGAPWVPFDRKDVIALPSGKILGVGDGWLRLFDPADSSSSWTMGWDLAGAFQFDGVRPVPALLTDGNVVLVGGGRYGNEVYWW
jgi:hypothetical protein